MELKQGKSAGGTHFEFLCTPLCELCLTEKHYCLFHKDEVTMGRCVLDLGLLLLLLFRNVFLFYHRFRAGPSFLDLDIQ